MSSCPFRFAMNSCDACDFPGPAPPEPSTLGCSPLLSEAMSAELREMQRDTEQAAQPSPAPAGRALAVSQKSGDKGDVALQRRPEEQQQRNRPLQRLPKELRARQQEARHCQVRDPWRLYLASLLGGATRWTAGNKFHSEKPVQQATARSPRARKKHREALRGERSLREVPPRHQVWHTKSRKKVTGSEKRGVPPGQHLSPPKKSKGKQTPSGQTSSGRQLMESRVGRRTNLEKLNPLLAAAGETKCLEKERAPEGTTRLALGLRNKAREQSSQGKLKDLEQLWPVRSTHKKGAMALASQCQCADKNNWQKELKSAIEELFHTSRELKEHLTWYLEWRPSADQNPAGEQVFSETQGPSSDSPEEVGTGQVEAVPAERAQSPQTAPQYNQQQLPSQAESTKMAPPSPKSESQTLPPEDRVSVERKDSILQSPKPGHQPPKPATPVEGSPQPPLQEQPEQAGWRASRQKQKTEVEGGRQPERPDISLEIHYKAELEEERRERRRTRLALLKAYPTGVPARQPRSHFALHSSIFDEEKHNQMIRDFQRQILEQNKMHKQFLEKARKRLQEFQKTW